MPEGRSREELLKLIDLSSQLGFYDDMSHWINELHELDKEQGR